MSVLHTGWICKRDSGNIRFCFRTHLFVERGFQFLSFLSTMPLFVHTAQATKDLSGVPCCFNASLGVSDSVIACVRCLIGPGNDKGLKDEEINYPASQKIHSGKRQEDKDSRHSQSPWPKSDSIHTQSNEPLMPLPCARIALDGEGRESQECLSDRGWYNTASAPLKQTGLALAQCEKAWALKCALVWALSTLMSPQMHKLSRGSECSPTQLHQRCVEQPHKHTQAYVLTLSTALKEMKTVVLWTPQCHTSHVQWQRDIIVQQLFPKTLFRQDYVWKHNVLLGVIQVGN